MKYTPKEEQELMAAIWDPEVADDPEAFVMFVYPWGQKNTPLEHKPGPRRWQRSDLQEIRRHIQRQKTPGKEMEVLKKATASGRGSGKSAEVAWLTNWFMSTRLGSTTIVTANTEQQLNKGLDKVKVARAVSESKPDLSVLDLRERIRKLVKFIWEANPT